MLFKISFLSCTALSVRGPIRGDSSTTSSSLESLEIVMRDFDVTFLGVGLAFVLEVVYI